jgi:glutamate-ammonia-ligase adenylyltransferase
MHHLRNYPFRDPRRAQREIAELESTLPDAILRQLELLLVACPAPEAALNHFTTLRERQPAAFRNLTASIAGLRYLVTIFSYSRFLSEEILERPAWARKLLASEEMERALSAEEFRAQLLAELPRGIPQPLQLAMFRRRQIMRIVLRDVLELGGLAEITGELTSLADAIVEVAYERIRQNLVEHYGTPRESAEPAREAQFAVIALGKMGGEELNYSSDIDLMFLYSANGETDGPQSISNKEFFKRVANQLTALLSAYTAEGLCYRVDLRLRPDGSLGEVCLSVEGAKQYYATRARDWELQMMIKARVAAGHKPTGRALLDFVETRTYSTTLDFSVVEQLSETRERLNEKLSARHARKATPYESVDVKLDRGGIRDIEFLVQCLQRMYGGAQQWVRHRGTLLALARLHEKNVLSGAEYGKLASAYQFLRHLEHRLQFDEDRQTHSLPDNSRALELLARRMPQGGGSVEWLVRSLNLHFQQVLEIYERVVHAKSAPVEPRTAAPGSGGNVVPALDQTAPQLARAMAHDLRRGYRAFEHFLERLWSDSERIGQLNRDPELARATLDLFEHSPHFAEELIRKPDLLDEVAQARERLADRTPAPADPAELRRWFRREMLRIQVESICYSHPIFDTLDRTSSLADAVIARAYEISVAAVRSSHPPQDPAYIPKDQMHAIALGRLGMREFDLGSDADLVFVLPEADAAEMEYWSRVANRICDLISAYTGSGVLFAVDTRLRPNGSAGKIVQTEQAVLQYFEQSAEAWEGITYMKSRIVGGNAERGRMFLGELQRVDWRRYGQSGRSRTDLRQMRARLEREQGAAQPLKAGRGGYYDIDFLLMYLRLKSAGVFFQVLNTPERIEVLENMGHLGREEARFLREAATFYRALDHGLRVISGHAESRLPKTEAQQDLLGELLARWSLVPLGDLEVIQTRTRALFDRYFS